MARKKTETPEPPPEGLRRCIGSQRFGIEPHDAPVGEFPRQPSQKDGLGRMCRSHWNAYTAGLARDAKARKAADRPVRQAIEEPDAAEPTTIGDRANGAGIDARSRP